MATFDSTLYGQQKADRANPARLAPPNVASGSVEFARVFYTLAGTEAGTDVIRLLILPADCIPIPELSSVTCADPGTTLTLDIGNASDPDGWADGIVLSAGGQVNCTNTAVPAWAITQVPMVPDAGRDDNAIVYATVASAASLTAATVLSFVLAYKLGR